MLIVQVGFYEKLLPDNEELQRGIVYDLRIPELLALQRDAVLMLAEACVPKDLTHDTSFSSSWREEDTLQQWQIKMVMISELGATTKKHQGAGLNCPLSNHRSVMFYVSCQVHWYTLTHSHGSGKWSPWKTSFLFEQGRFHLPM